MICAMCLKDETPSEKDQLCKECTLSLKYAEVLIARTGVGIKITYNKGIEVGSMPERGDLSPVPEPVEKVHWTVEMTPVPDLDGDIDQPVYEGSADSLKEACNIALAKLNEDAK